jgi:hypothetical protein
MLKAIRQIMALEWSQPFPAPDQNLWRMKGVLGDYPRIISGKSRLKLLVLAWDMARGQK